MKLVLGFALCCLLTAGAEAQMRGGVRGGGGFRGGMGLGAGHGARGGAVGGFRGGASVGGWRGGSVGGWRGGWSGGSRYLGGYRGGYGYSGWGGGYRGYAGYRGFRGYGSYAGFYGGYYWPYSYSYLYPSFGYSYGSGFYADGGAYPYSGYGYAASYPAYDVSPNVTVVYPAQTVQTRVIEERARPVTREYDEYGQEVRRETGEAASPIYLIAFKSGVIHAAASYWTASGTLHYVTLQHEEKQASLDAVDLGMSLRLNRERRVPFQIPAQ